MRPLELARRYMDIVFSNGPYDDLRYILADDCVFTGPFHTFDTAAAYIDALNADPPQGFGYTVIREYSDADSACLVYRFTKPGISTLMAQYFEVSGDRITRIALIFDRQAFAP